MNPLFCQNVSEFLDERKDCRAQVYCDSSSPFHSFFSKEALLNYQSGNLGGGNPRVAIDNVLNKFFWFGLTEHFAASVCLLSYQLGQYDAKKCSCGRRRPITAHSQAGKSNQKVSASEALKLESLLHADLLLYNEASREFFRRIVVAEKHLNTSLLCDSISLAL